MKTESLTLNPASFSTPFIPRIMSDQSALAVSTATKKVEVTPPVAGSNDKSEGVLVTNDDAKSVLSDTSTLAEGKKTASPSIMKKKKNATSAASQDNPQLDSATAFAKEAKKKGWAAPTATRPTFG
ncbi:hypothetical protein BC628DRAFT_1414773 [Trametes gibbosa]|nr:hypothetical protein BC628DRAFT_1414773 [Trametes gibbosa]